MTTTDSLRALVVATPDGIRARGAAATLFGVSHATAAALLARLWWAGVVDRRKDGASFLYTPRAQ